MAARTPLENWIARRTFGGRAFGPDALFAWQMEQLRSVVEYAKAHSPFYSRHLAGFQAPRMGAGAADLPLTGEEDLRRAGHKMLCVSQGEIERVVTLDTTGTTGPPKRLWFTREEQADIIDFFHHGMSTLAGEGDRVMILLPHERPGSVGDLLAAGLLRLGAEPLRHGLVRNLGACLDAIEKDRANVLVGTPASVRGLAVYARAAGRRHTLKSVLLSTDYASDAAKEAIADAFCCEVFDHYGMTEMGLGGGVECEAHAGYHLRELDLLFEVIHPHTLRPLPAGEYGEVVISTLRRTGMPLIRYRTGDISRFLPGVCPCGSPLRRLERIAGRLGQEVALDKGALSMPLLDEALFRLPGLLDFTAAFAAGPTPCLRIEAAVLDIVRPACNATDIQNALLATESLAAAAANGALTVEIALRAVSDWPGLHTGKRRLARA